MTEEERILLILVAKLADAIVEGLGNGHGTDAWRYLNGEIGDEIQDLTKKISHD